MECIKVTFPKSLKPDTVKKCIEGNLETNSRFRCKVEFEGIEDGENVYKICTDYSEAFYLIGMTAAELIKRIS